MPRTPRCGCACLLEGGLTWLPAQDLLAGANKPAALTCLSMLYLLLILGLPADAEQPPLSIAEGNRHLSA